MDYTLRGHVANLFILATTIVIVYIAKRNFKDYFVPNVPTTPIGNGIAQDPRPPQQNLDQMPMRFGKQMWPAQIPYQPKPNTPCTVNPVNGTIGCPGALGTCQNGVCQPKDYGKTAFGIPFA